MDRSDLLERLKWLAEAPKGAEPPDWLPSGDWARGIAEVAQAARDEFADQERSFDLRWNADQRAIKRWQAAAPAGEDRSLTWPDHADLVVWLLGQLDEAELRMKGRVAYPDQPAERSLLECHYRSALSELESMKRWKAEHVMDWRPIAEAPIPPVREAPEGFVFNCFLQTTRGIVGEGCARYVSDGRVRNSKRVPILRWYHGDGARNGSVCHDPRYFMPLPQPRKD